MFNILTLTQNFDQKITKNRHFTEVSTFVKKNVQNDYEYFQADPIIIFLAYKLNHNKNQSEIYRRLRIRLSHYWNKKLSQLEIGEKKT